MACDINLALAAGLPPSKRDLILLKSEEEEEESFLLYLVWSSEKAFTLGLDLDVGAAIVVL